MALGFSSGLFQAMQQTGQGGAMPQDPNDRNLLQKAGVTNPLLQQFGQGFGGMFGMDMRSNNQIAKEEIAKVAMSGTPAEKKMTAQKLLSMGMQQTGQGGAMPQDPSGS